MHGTNCTRRALSALFRLCAVCLVLVLPGMAEAASNDEIQVYDDAINKPGEMGLDMHINHVMTGLTQPAWPGDAPSNRSTRVTPEFSYGLDGNWELGAYLPLLMTEGGTKYVEGAKARAKYLSAAAGEAFYWGINQELGWVSRRSAEQYWNLEVRPILGYRPGKWNLSFNPIVDFEPAHLHLRPLDFHPACRAVYELRPQFSLGVEHYSDLSRPDAASPYQQRPQNTYLVVDAAVAGYAINFGVGKGWNASSDKWTVKAIIGTRF